MMIYSSAIALIAIVAYRFKSLTGLGALTAFLIGVLIAYFFEVQGLIILALFFITSTVLGRLKASSFTREKEQRTSLQVLANGGVAAVAALLVPFFGDIAVYLFLASLAAATSDTWATEIGRRYGGKPFHLRQISKDEIGRSGAMTIIGTIASLAGSFLIAIAGFALFSLPAISIVIITLAGFIGAFIDTVVGAFIQEERRCVVCGDLTEDKHHCERQTVFGRGVPKITNNVVNFICTSSAALITLLFV
ncbi:DUF92 domain-containing protein [Geomicrobium sediminis]|uniref:Uncharacterized protein (TIGR00297 family) n=1 Tax=Geomicrobium sediminis TaxID=1347788 RepID=A0ABS2PE61_9BACL|nr:DUF92 domain-containing protein [Geomicrobium sediminis]MBM7633714.1 uncharacterized protein (TIGR00297 family) [Geomicrobium sediminis]